jgi:hypothetical protein
MLTGTEMALQPSSGGLVAALRGTDQNAWIGFMKRQLKKYPKMQLVSIVYGNDDRVEVYAATNPFNSWVMVLATALLHMSENQVLDSTLALRLCEQGGDAEGAAVQREAEPLRGRAGEHQT